MKADEPRDFFECVFPAIFISYIAAIAAGLVYGLFTCGHECEMTWDFRNLSWIVGLGLAFGIGREIGEGKFFNRRHLPPSGR